MKYKLRGMDEAIYKLDISSTIRCSNANTCCGIREIGNFLGLSCTEIWRNGIIVRYYEVANNIDYHREVKSDPFLHVEILLEKLASIKPRLGKVDIAYVPEKEEFAPAAIALQLSGFHEVERSKSNHGRYMNVIYMRKGMEDK